MDKRVLKQLKEFEKGDYIRVSWFDANDQRGRLEELQENPEVLVEDWGIFLGVEGSPQYVLLGKAYVPEDHRWDATCIHLELVQGAILVAKHVTKIPRRYRVEFESSERRRVRVFG
jgi:hypothetical protein